MPSVDDDVAGLLLTRHIMYVWLSVVAMICKDSHNFCVRMHEARGFRPTSLHIEASNTQLNASQQWEEKDCTHWDRIYTVALSKYT